MVGARLCQGHGGSGILGIDFYCLIFQATRQNSGGHSKSQTNAVKSQTSLIFTSPECLPQRRPRTRFLGRPVMAFVSCKALVLQLLPLDPDLLQLG